MDAVKYLKKLGLSEYESKAYIALVKLKNAKAKEISDESKVPQSKIYEVLASLEKKNMVTTIPSKPKKFAVIDPGIAIKNLISIKAKAIKELMDEEKEIIRSIEKNEKNVEKPKFNIYFGNKIHIRLATEAILKEKKEIWLMARKFAHILVVNAVKKFLKKGGKYRMIIEYVDEENARFIKELLKVGAKIRKTNIHGIKMLICSDQTGISFLNPDNPRSFITIIVEGSTLKDAMRNFFNTLWENSEKVTLKDLKKFRTQ